MTWDPLTPEALTQNFLAFWNWLMAIRAGAHAVGQTFRAYCYSAAAENTYLRKLGIAGEVLDQVEGFIDSDDWVDMLRVFDGQLITGGGSGLKVVAPLAGHTWEVDDPGGEESMLRYEVAVGSSSSEAERLAAREWLLTYNRGDVEATLAIRGWLDGNSSSIARSDPSTPNASALTGRSAAPWVIAVRVRGADYGHRSYPTASRNTRPSPGWAMTR